MEAQLPEGAEGPLEYQWYLVTYSGLEAIAGATTNTLTVTAAAEDIGRSRTFLTKNYSLAVICEEGTTYQNVNVTFVPGFIDSFRYAFLFIRGGMDEDALKNSPGYRTGYAIGLVMFIPFILMFGAATYFNGVMTYYGIVPV